MKVHILGAPGSGKSTLAQEISARFDVPHYELDQVDWEQENVIGIGEKPAWVVEGIYLIFTEPLLSQADYIVLLEISWRVAAWRMVRRHIMNSLRGTNRYPGINGIKGLVKLVKDARLYIFNLDQAKKSSIEALRSYFETHPEVAAPATEDALKIYVDTYQDLIIPPTDEFVRMYLARYKEKLFLVRTRADHERLLDLLAGI